MFAGFNTLSGEYSAPIDPSFDDGKWGERTAKLLSDLAGLKDIEKMSYLAHKLSYPIGLKFAKIYLQVNKKQFDLGLYNCMKHPVASSLFVSDECLYAAAFEQDTRVVERTRQSLAEWEALYFDPAIREYHLSIMPPWSDDPKEQDRLMAQFTKETAIPQYEAPVEVDSASLRKYAPVALGAIGLIFAKQKLLILAASAAYIALSDKLFKKENT